MVTGPRQSSGYCGAVQGFFRRLDRLDLPTRDRNLVGHPVLYVIIIMFAILGRSFWLLVVLLDPVRLDGAGGCGAGGIPARAQSGICPGRARAWRVERDDHVPPHAAQRHGRHADDAAVYHHGHDLIAGCSGFPGLRIARPRPSLGELTLQAKQNLQAPWLAFTAFFTFAIMLSLLIFIFEGIRDAFDPRKTFS